MDNKIMSDEIFDPVLPVLQHETLNEIYRTADLPPQHPLACYMFSESTTFQKEIVNNIQYGGTYINNCIFHALT